MAKIKVVNERGKVILEIEDTHDNVYDYMKPYFDHLKWIGDNILKVW